MGKYIEIKIELAKCKDGSIIWNTGDGVAILIEENSIYSEIHKYFSRALANVSRTERQSNIPGVINCPLCGGSECDEGICCNPFDEKGHLY